MGSPNLSKERLSARYNSFVNFKTESGCPARNKK